ncbi:endoplasmic reticulum membrane-associated RNA degradation protein-like [Crassostrea virginica]
MEILGIETCLSAKVHFLITKVGKDKLNERSFSLTPEGCIDWEKACSYLPGTRSDSHEYFVTAVEALSPVFFEAEKHLLSSQWEDIWIKHKNHLKWIPENHHQAVVDSLKSLRSDNSSDHLLALQLLSSILERALGDVFENESCLQCPSLLKDILNSREITQVFGTHVIQILRILMGPPTSLNLRNLVWHGFPSPGEIPRRYGCFLYLTIPSLGRILEDKGKQPVAHRKLMELELDPSITRDFPDLKNHLSTVKTMIDITQSLHGRKTLLQCILGLVEDQRSMHAAILLLPQLEHLLRLTFASVNSCSERVLTAESDTLFTTLSEIFEKYLPNGDVNRISETLGESLMDLLFDLLVYPDGPRIRDRVGHGESNLQNFPESLSSAIVLAFVLVLWKCSKSADQNALFKDLTIFETQYSAFYHPLSIVKQKILQVAEDVARLPDVLQYDAELTPRKEPQHNSLLEILTIKADKDMFEAIQGVTKDMLQLICQDWGILQTPEEISNSLFQVFSDGRTMFQMFLEGKISTLYRFCDKQQNTLDFTSKGTGACEAEIAGLLSRVLTELQTSIQQVMSTLSARQKQLADRCLRSRQRDNLIRLIRSCPFHCHSAHVVLLLCSWKLYTLSIHTGPKLLRFLKQLLQFVENLRTFTNPENNKWTDCVSAYREFMLKAKAALTELEKQRTP